MANKRNIQLFIDKRPKGIKQPSGFFNNKNETDFYITVALFKDNKLVNEYIDIGLDPTRTKIERQEFNPFFMELGFFNTINKIGSEDDLSTDESSLIGKAKKYNITINS